MYSAVALDPKPFCTAVKLHGEQDVLLKRQQFCLFCVICLLNRKVYYNVIYVILSLHMCFLMCRTRQHILVRQSRWDCSGPQWISVFTRLQHLQAAISLCPVLLFRKLNWITLNEVIQAGSSHFVGTSWSLPLLCRKVAACCERGRAGCRDMPMIRFVQIHNCSVQIIKVLPRSTVCRKQCAKRPRAHIAHSCSLSMVLTKWNPFLVLLLCNLPMHPRRILQLPSAYSC